MPMAGAEATGTRNHAASHLLFRSAAGVLKVAPSSPRPLFGSRGRAARGLEVVACSPACTPPLTDASAFGQRSDAPGQRTQKARSCGSQRFPQDPIGPSRACGRAGSLGELPPERLFVKPGLTLGSVLDDLLALEIVTGVIAGAIRRQP